ncbi:MAG: hypothetical protein V3W44_01290 [Dehalococcoidales bacterium]
MDRAATGRYSNEELSKMATTVIHDLSVGGHKSFALVITMATVTGMEPEAVIDEICNLVA